MRDWDALGVKTVKGRNPIDPDALPEVAFTVVNPDGNIIDVTGDSKQWRGTGNMGATPDLHATIRRVRLPYGLPVATGTRGPLDDVDDGT